MKELDADRLAALHNFVEGLNALSAETGVLVLSGYLVDLDHEQFGFDLSLASYERPHVVVRYQLRQTQ